MPYAFPHAVLARRIPPALLLVAMLACGDDPTAPPTTDAALITKETGDQALAHVGAAVSPRPSVLVTDEDGEPVADFPISFVVLTGNGTVTGGSVETDADGIATVGEWRLGTIGANTLTAFSPGMPELDAVTFSATARCPASAVIDTDAAVNGALAGTDCRYASGPITDRYTMTLTAQQMVRVSLASAAFDAWLELFAPDATLVAENDDSGPTTTNSIFTALLPAGTYQVGVTSFGANETGAYQLTTEPLGSNVGGCVPVFVMPGVVTDQQLQVTDCAYAPPDVFYFDTYRVFMIAGQPYTITMTSTVFDTFLELYRDLGPDEDPVLVASNDDIGGSGGTNSRIFRFTPEVSGLYILDASSKFTTTTGGYSLTITSP